MSSSNEPAAAAAATSQGNGKPAIPTDAPRTTGTVKWFSNRKCFGFLTSHTEGEEDVFVHQSSIHSEGFRTLKEGMVVEYTVGKDDSGRPKAEHITAVGGGYITLPPRRSSAGAGASHIKDEGGDEAEPEADGAIQEGAATATEKSGRSRRGGRQSSKTPASTVAPDMTDGLVEPTGPEEEEEGENNKNGRKSDKNMPARPPRGARQSGRGTRTANVVNETEGTNFKKDAAAAYWHSALSDSVKQTLINEKNIPLKMSSLDLALDKTARIKLGNEGYATCVHIDGVIAEGKFTLVNAEDGSVIFTWDRCIVLNDGDDGKVWVAEENLNNLPSKVPRELSLKAENIFAVHVGDEVAKVWKDDDTVPDARKVLEDNGFAMRRVFWVPHRFGHRSSHTAGGGRGARRGRGGMKTAPPQSAL